MREIERTPEVVYEGRFQFQFWSGRGKLRTPVFVSNASSIVKTEDGSTSPSLGSVKIIGG